MICGPTPSQGCSEHHGLPLGRRASPKCASAEEHRVTAKNASTVESGVPGPMMQARAHNLADACATRVQALGRLRARSWIVDCEAVSCGDDGIASFERTRDSAWRTRRLLCFPRRAAAGMFRPGAAAARAGGKCSSHVDTTTAAAGTRCGFYCATAVSGG